MWRVMMSEDPEASHHYESWAGRGPSSSSFEAPVVPLLTSFSLTILLGHRFQASTPALTINTEVTALPPLYK